MGDVKIKLRLTCTNGHEVVVVENFLSDIDTAAQARQGSRPKVCPHVGCSTTLKAKGEQ